MRYDVAIVGAGPAGAWAACRLASHGARVALLDPSHPREKPCGGGVTGRALARLGQHAPFEGVSIDTSTFTFESAVATVAVRDHTDSRLSVFSREIFDSALVARATTAGAALLPRRVTGVRRDGNVWRVACRGGDVAADWIIGADGANSLVRKQLSRPFARSDLSIACGYYVHGISSSRIDIAFETRPAGYLWSFPRRDHLAVGVCAQADEASVATLLPVVDQWIAAYDDGDGVQPLRTAPRTRYSWPIPSLTAGTLERERPAGDRWLLVGDAAGLVDPITREGIYFALDSGELAAEAIVGNRPAAGYVERIRDTTYAELILAARLKARFYRPTFIALLLEGLQRSDRIRDVMGDLIAGNQPYGSLRRRLLKTLELRLMLDLFGVTARNSRRARAQ